MTTDADADADLAEAFTAIEDEGIQKFVDSWNELTASVRAELEDKK
jgi:transaldolase